MPLTDSVKKTFRGPDSTPYIMVRIRIRDTRSGRDAYNILRGQRNICHSEG